MHIRRWIFAGLVLAVSGYFVYEARDLIFAPTLEIFEPASVSGMPKDFAEISATHLRITGRTDPFLKVWISGREAQADEKGFFEDNIPVWPGYNEIGIKVSDKFGNETRKILKVVVK